MPDSIERERERLVKELQEDMLFQAKPLTQAQIDEGVALLFEYRRCHDPQTLPGMKRKMRDWFDRHALSLFKTAKEHLDG